MDKVYEAYNLQASPKICLKDYFEEYGQLAEPYACYDADKSAEEKILQLMDIELSQSRLQLIAHYCSIDNLKLPVEDIYDEECKKGKCKDDKTLEKIVHNTQLETIKALKAYDTVLVNNYKHHNGIKIKYEKSNLDNTSEVTVTPGSDFLVYVRIYEPFKYSLRRRETYKQCLPLLRLKNIISIVGCQTLAELREKIMCISDLSISMEISENPNKLSTKMAKDVYKSGFFYIEDTFYNDTRDPNNINYSSVILKWAEARNIGPFKTAIMENTKIRSLCVRFGFPWVYQHQGCCEHLIVLSDARLVTKDDELAISSYPRIERIRPNKGKNCIMCGILNVRWITTEHDRIPHDTSYFCDRCFKSYNYIDGKKVGNFKAYRYPYIPELMLKKRSNT